MTTPKVAVITRTKNRPTFLKRAIQSIHNQTMSDIVHVIYNDAGDRQQLESLVDTYATLSKDRIKIIHGPGSNGMEDTIFNKAIAAVDSTYIAVHDDDDSWHPEFLAQTVAHLEKNNAQGVVVRTDKITERLQEDGSLTRLKSEQWLPDVQVINLYRQCIDNQMTSITFLYRRSVYDEIGGYDDNLAVCGDWDFGIRFLQKYDVEYLDPGYALAFYHHRAYQKNAEGNTSGAGNNRFKYYTNYLLNKYLRQELAEGRLGVGYIMSKLRYDQSNLAAMVRKVLPAFVTDRLKRRIQG